MKLTEQELERNRSAFREMSLRERGDYLFTYYKLPIALAFGVLLVLVGAVYGRATKRTPCLYVGLVNVSIGSELEEAITQDFLRTCGESKSKVELYQGIVLTDDPSSEAYQYVYASRLKTLAAIESKELDVVLMNREAYDAFSQSGYLARLDELLGSDAVLGPNLVQNLVIYEDNAEEHTMDESVAYAAVTGEEVNGVDCSGFPVFQRAGLEEPVYLGIIANTPRAEKGGEYLRFLGGA